MHTSIIYVTKKVIHWGANHPTLELSYEKKKHDYATKVAQS